MQCTLYSTRKPELRAIEVYIAGIGILDVFDSYDLDLDPMTFIYKTDQVLHGDILDVQI